MAESQVAEQPEQTADKRPLNDVMLAMDVVDTLRHRASLVERELNSEEREQQLILRLREIYAAQGIDVPDNVLSEGVVALDENRFTYVSPKPGLAVKLANIYVNRNRWIKPLLTVLGLAAAAWLGYVLLVSGPRKQMLRELPRQVAVQQQAVVDLARVEEAKNRAHELSASANKALARGDVPEAKRALARLQELRDHLKQEYELRVVSDGSTGVWRVPDVNTSARNYYIIVEPIAPDGKVLTMPVTTEEDGKTKNASKWGLRVDEKTFIEVAADKKDDGIIQRNRFGVKKPGYLQPDYMIPTTGGAILTW